MLIALIFHMGLYLICDFLHFDHVAGGLPCSPETGRTQRGGSNEQRVNSPNHRCPICEASTQSRKWAVKCPVQVQIHSWALGNLPALLRSPSLCLSEKQAGGSDARNRSSPLPSRHREHLS